ncbi:hypothetical protein AmFV_015 [Apis mellifera filamentous virus]|uniref:hypothetical protein n=1 Tax=Apis mellifera filamentous virus TaxID=1100043 RepID=UPI0006BD3458|nr:hypothetical protein APL35_gp015 [Apis mellifera filamentous virus]UQL06515.1 hypothetical protein AmFV_015 [Apis mellifera filamentous virus]WLJ60175.1 MAG: hypothetical protein AmFV_00024 [Apis mellifera filamentous virus]WOK43126.1 MAG: hypothetical protein [Apis mellifera filamentous virus]WOK43422.1 MAG: hypothetical protein [Apis mellifera filamentous virus]WOK43651.1 MAG: hypothetical protein [Apis mellifera filamentous virus]
MTIQYQYHNHNKDEQTNMETKKEPEINGKRNGKTNGESSIRRPTNQRPITEQLPSQLVITI